MSDRLAQAKARNAELKAQLAAKESTQESSVGRSLAKGARNVGAGVLDLADFVASPVREGLNLGAKALGSNYRFKPSAEAFTDYVDTASDGLTRPETDTEKVEEAIQRGVATLPVGGAAAKAIPAGGNLTKAAKTFLAGSSEVTPINVASTAGATGLMQNALNEDPENSVGAMTMGLVGGLAPQGARLATKAGRQLANERLARDVAGKVDFDQHAMDSFEKAGVTPLLADVSGSKVLKMTNTALSKVPFVGKKIADRQSQQYNEALSLLGQGDYGAEGLSRSEASKLAKTGAKTHQQASEATHNRMFGQLEHDIGQLEDRTIQPNAIREAAQELTKNNINQQMKKDFNKSPVGKQLLRLKKAISGKKNLDYFEAKRILRDIKDTISTHGLIGDETQGELKFLAKAIGNDIEESLGGHLKELGKDSHDNWKNVRAIYADYAENEIPFLNQLYKKDKQGGTDAFLHLITNVKKGGETAALSVQGLSNAERASLMQAVNERLGKPSANAPFSVNTWAKNYNSLEPKVQKLITAHLGKDNQKRVNHLVDAIGRMKSTVAEANTSNTAYNAMLYGMMTQGASSLGSAAFGNPLPLAKDITVLLAGRMGASALTNKKLITWLSDSMKTKDLKTLAKRIENASKMKGLPQAATHTFKEAVRMMNTPPEKPAEKSPLETAREKNARLKAELAKRQRIAS